jgi:hypothetical protein
MVYENARDEEEKIDDIIKICITDTINESKLTSFRSEGEILRYLQSKLRCELNRTARKRKTEYMVQREHQTKSVYLKDRNQRLFTAEQNLEKSEHMVG